MSSKKLKELTQKTISTIKNEGAKSLLQKTRNYTINIFNNRKREKCYKDLLFINGCSLPHPQRYRVDHQIEQLESFNLSCDKIYFEHLDLSMVKQYRGFVFYRCPVLPIITDFIKQAKRYHKTVFYDIDDLVFDTQYTNQIPYVQSLDSAAKSSYDDGVNRMGETLRLCDYGITTTTRLQSEMLRFLPEVFINRNVASEEMLKYSKFAIRHPRFISGKVILGYFSGSITHNADFQLIQPTIIKLMHQYPNLYLKVVGLLDIPPAMSDLQDRILTAPFTDWEKLPELIRSVDINLAPLEQSIFNEAKSENKWTEAALVKVPTVASDLGAFHEVIQNRRTGILCDNTAASWEAALTKLIKDSAYRAKLGEAACQYVITHYLTTSTGKPLADFINQKLHPNLFFVLPSTNISGGTMVAMKHAAILQQHGFDVGLLNLEKSETDITMADQTIPVLSAQRHFSAHIDTLVGTMWSTLEYVQHYGDVSRRKYLVQNYETNFYEYNRPEKRQANSTYNQLPGIEYLTISQWCRHWLTHDFHNTVHYAPNGIDTAHFSFQPRHFKRGQKIKILIEGSSKHYYKNVDESFKIANQLDPTQYEIHYLTYEDAVKKWYRVDVLHQKVPHAEVAQVYQQCDILLKSSILESFSYPPLEMMATGGFCVVAPNDGNAEYLSDGHNCLLYQQGNYSQALQQIQRLVDDSQLRQTLLAGAQETVHTRDWCNYAEDIIKLYK